MAKAGKLEEGNRIPNTCCTRASNPYNVIKAKIDNTQEQSKCRMCVSFHFIFISFHLRVALQLS